MCVDIQSSRENMDLEQLICAKPVLVTVEAEATLPGSLRDEARVYLADGNAYIIGTEISGNRLTIDGRVNFHALYAQGNLEKMASIDTNGSFSQQLALLGENSGNGNSDVRASASVQEISTRVFNGRLLFKANVQLSAQIETRQTVSVISGIQNTAELQSQGKEVVSASIVGRGETENVIKQEISLSQNPDIAETLFGIGRAQVKDITGGADGKIGVSGEIELDVYHAGTKKEKPLIITHHTFPYEQSVLLSGALGDAVSASSVVCDVAVAANETGAEKTMRVETLVHTKIFAVEDKKQYVLTDIYSIGQTAVEPVYVKSVTTMEIVDTQAAESGKTTLNLADGSLRVQQILAVHIRPFILEAKNEGDKLGVDGVIHCTLIYLTEGQNIPVSMELEEPFSTQFKTSARADDMMSVTVGSVESSAITGDRVDVKYILHLSASGVRQEKGSYISDIVEGKEQAIEPGIDLYITQPGESLWDLGKRPKVSPDALSAFNPETKDHPDAGNLFITYRQ